MPRQPATTSARAQSWSTSDLGTAAYLKMKGLVILAATRSGGSRGKWVFSFADPESRAKQLQVEYINSDERRFDAEVRSLKKLCWDDGRGR